MSTRLNFTLLWVYCSDGGLDTIANYPVSLSLWKSRLAAKQALPASQWPFNLNIIEIDLHSDPTLVQSLVIAPYLQNAAVAATIDLIIGPPDFLTFMIAPYADAAQIPLIAPASSQNAELSQYGTRAFDYSFFMLPPPGQAFNALELAFRNAGIRSVAYVALDDDHNGQSCQSAAQVLQGKGVELKQSFLLPAGTNSSVLYDTVRQMRDTIKPDLLLWCEWQACFENPGTIMQPFKDLQYMPGGLSILDCIQSYSTYPQDLKTLYEYTVSPAYTVPSLAGSDFDEENTPYASQFVPPQVANATGQTLISVLSNAGSHPLQAGQVSSALLLQESYKSVVGIYAAYSTVALWGAIDVVETVLYKASQAINLLGSTNTSSVGLVSLIEGASVATPFGRVTFDTSHVNFGLQSLLVQASCIPSCDTPVILPATLSTATLIYPAPTWAERTYQPQYMQTGAEYGIISLATLASALMVIIMISAFRHRAKPAIRMLHYAHMQLQAAAAVMISLVMALVWTPDTTPALCSASWWLLYIPLSFVIWVNNMKMYRLSKFLRNEKFRQIHFPHSKVMKLALAYTMVTVIALLISQLASPPTVQLVVQDPLRPLYNYHQCTGHSANNVILIIVFLFHFLASAACTFSVRNGIEGFRDGATVKEAFLILYMCLILAYGLSQAPLSNQSLYGLRAALVMLGVTLFLVRIWASRLLVLWLGEESLNKLASAYNHLFTASSVDKVSYFTNQSQTSLADAESPVYPTLAVSQTSTTQMWNTLQRPELYQKFYKFAQQQYSAESLDFCQAVQQYQEEYMVVVEGSVQTHVLPGLHDLQHQVFNQYIRAGSVSEVNISSTQRTEIARRMETVKLGTPDICMDVVTNKHTIRALFDTARSEVSAMLYQNLWQKFRSAMTEAQMGASHDDYRKNSVTATPIAG